MNGHWIPNGSHLLQSIGCLVLRNSLVGSKIPYPGETELKWNIPPISANELFHYHKEWMAEHLWKIFKMDIEWHHRNILKISSGKLWKIAGRNIQRKANILSSCRDDRKIHRVISQHRSASTIWIWISLVKMVQSKSYTRSYSDESFGYCEHFEWDIAIKRREPRRVKNSSLQ